MKYSAVQKRLQILWCGFVCLPGGVIGVVRFLLVFSFFTIVCVAFLLYSFGVIKEEPTKAMSEKSRKMWTFVLRVLALIIAIPMLFLIVIPMARDIPELMRSNVRIVQGKPSYIDRGPYGSHLRRTVMINGIKVRFHFYYPLSTKETYRVSYLPHSHYGLEARVIE